MERVKLVPMECSRTYNFPNGHQIVYKNVVAVYSSKGKTSRIETLNEGETLLHIINSNWLSIDIDTPNFTV